jgi:TolA-binding protein
MLSLLISLACSGSPTADPALERTELNDQGATSYVEGTSPSSELYLQAQDAVIRGDLDAAHALYTELSGLEPHSEAPWVGLASVALMGSDVDSADELYTHAHALAPTATQPMLGLGTVAMERRQHDDARAWYAKVLA